MAAIRTSAKALIIRDEQLLTVRCRGKDGELYLILPGGGQEHGETLDDALRRECQEEIGCAVRVGPIRFVRDYIGRKHRFALMEEDVHQLEIMFECAVPEGYVAGIGTSPDTYQSGVEWVPLNVLHNIPFYPKGLARLLATEPLRRECVYLGDGN